MPIGSSGSVIVQKIGADNNFYEEVLDSSDVPVTTTGTEFTKFGISGSNLQTALSQLCSHSAPAPFQWGNSWQVYPFEVSTSGNPLYGREFLWDHLTWTGTGAATAHGISNFHKERVYSIDGVMWNNASGVNNELTQHIPYIIAGSPAYQFSYYINATHVRFSSSTSMSGSSGRCRILYEM